MFLILYNYEMIFSRIWLFCSNVVNIRFFNIYFIIDLIFVLCIDCNLKEDVYFCVMIKNLYFRGGCYVESES